jgi:hypothetical protein
MSSRGYIRKVVAFDSESSGAAPSTLAIFDALGRARALLDEGAGAGADAGQHNGATVTLVAAQSLAIVLGEAA